MLNRDDLIKLLEQDPLSIIDTVLLLQQRILDLEQRLNLNSENSSKPSSTNNPWKPKPKSLREKTGKKSGGQLGHRGTTITRREKADIETHHRPDKCECGCILTDVPVHKSETRQVIDIPLPAEIVTNHIIETVICPNCRKKNRGIPPAEAPAAIQYGYRLCAKVADLSVNQMIATERIAQYIQDHHGIEVSEGTIDSMLNKTYTSLESHEVALREALMAASVVHSDETGVRVEGKLHWEHTVSSGPLTLLVIHKKRGGEAITTLPIADYKGVLVHDCWPPYNNLPATHALCGEHICRELQGCFELGNQPWAKCMRDFLYEQNRLAHEFRLVNEWFSQDQRATIRQRYREIIANGYAINPPPEAPLKPRRGRVARGKTLCLLDRLLNYEDPVLLFTERSDVPFTNNRAEQALRLTKVKMKVSGTFRSQQGADRYARIRAFSSTVKSYGLNILNCLRDALEGNPFLPQSI